MAAGRTRDVAGHRGAATEPRAKGGELYAPQFGSHGAAVRRPILRRVDLQEQIDVLWQVSERESGIPLDVGAAGSRRRSAAAMLTTRNAIRSEYIAFSADGMYSSAVRVGVAERFAEDAGGEMLTTGEAAALLGVSRQHIVDLCEAGSLPHSWVGKHRRIRRRDVALIAAGNHRVTRDQARSLMLAYVIAGRVVTDPDGARALARKNLRAMRESSARGATRVWMREWERLLDSPLTDLLTALTSPSPRSRELRQNNPFAGLLSDDERRQVLETARAADVR